jgi:hypothetical protein
MQDLSKAIFQRATQDEEELRKFHTGSSSGAIGAAALDQKGEAYWNARCRRMVKDKEVLKQELQQLKVYYSGPAGIDIDTGKALFTEHLTDQVFDAVYDLIDSDNFCGKP